MSYSNRVKMKQREGKEEKKKKQTNVFSLFKKSNIKFQKKEEYEMKRQT